MGKRIGAVLLIMLLTAWVATTEAQAQCTAKNTAFLPGEHISYDLMFNWKFIWIKVGYAELTTDSPSIKESPDTASG